jgi:hypothetical protein
MNFAIIQAYHCVEDFYIQSTSIVVHTFNICFENLILAPRVIFDSFTMMVTYLSVKPVVPFVSTLELKT